MLLQAHGETEGVGFSDPTGMQRKATDTEDEAEQNVHEAVPDQYTLAAAQS